jgi:hypothetical protein
LNRTDFIKLDFFNFHSTFVYSCDMKRESESEEKNKAAITMPISMSKEREQK